MHTVPTPTPSRGTPPDAPAGPVADEPGVFVEDAPTRPEPLVGELPVAEPEQAPPLPLVRRLVLGVRKQLPYALVLLTLVIGLLRIVQYHWREGSAWIGGALVLAAVLRAFLSPRTAGMVAVRGRWLDVAWCVGLAACIMFVAYTLKA